MTTLEGIRAGKGRGGDPERPWRCQPSEESGSSDAPASGFRFTREELVEPLSKEMANVLTLSLTVR